MRINICTTILTSVVALICFQTTSLAATITNQAELLVPFNDLLPPLLDNDTTTATTTTTKAPLTTKSGITRALNPTTIVGTTSSSKTKQTLTTHPPPVLFKSTKKSYYQQQTEHIKELHLIDDDPFVPHDYSEQAEHLQHLRTEQSRRDQHHPVQQRLQKLQKEQTKKLPKQQKPLKTTATPQDVAPKITQSFANQPKKTHQHTAEKTHTKVQNENHKEHQRLAHQNPATDTAHKAQVENIQPLTKQQQQSDKQHLPQQYRQQHRFQVPLQPLNFNALQQYFDFQHTTHRPPKAGLPTLTPFPRHLK